MNLFKNKINILVLGCNGMLGYDVYQGLLKKSQEKKSNIGSVIGFDIVDGMDFTRRNTLGSYFETSIHYDYCINCIAYTNTNLAENDDDGFVMSYKLNSLVPKYIAESCVKHNTKLIHISTDYVFSEFSNFGSVLYNEVIAKFKTNSEPFPINNYGMHKLIGELFIQNEFKGKEKEYTILRTSWLYGMHNSKSFIHKFLLNAFSKAIDGNAIEMTENEYSIPTSTKYVYECILNTILSNKNGILNAVCKSDDNRVSRLDFANRILEYFSDVEIKGKKASDIKIVPVKKKTYQPEYSQMDSSFNIFENWKCSLDLFFEHNKNSLKTWLESKLG